MGLGLVSDSCSCWVLHACESSCCIMVGQISCRPRSSIRDCSLIPYAARVSAAKHWEQRTGQDRGFNYWSQRRSFNYSIESAEFVLQLSQHRIETKDLTLRSNNVTFQGHMVINIRIRFGLKNVKDISKKKRKTYFVSRGPRLQKPSSEAEIVLNIQLWT